MSRENNHKGVKRISVQSKEMLKQLKVGQLKTRSIKETHRYARHKMLFEERLGGEERRLMHLVPAPAVRLMKRRVLSRPGVNSLMSSLAWWITNVASFQVSTAWLDPKKNEREA